MGLSGLAVYKLLPKTNCKECGFATCLAFAMKLAARQVELSDCPYVSEEAKAQLDAASAPPIRLIAVGANEHKIEVGNETVLFRHERTFYHQPGLFIRLRADLTDDEYSANLQTIAAYEVERVGIQLDIDGVAVESTPDAPERFAERARRAAEAGMAVILMANDPDTMGAGLKATQGALPLMYAADQDNWEPMARLAARYKVPLAVRGSGDLAALAALTTQIEETATRDLVLDPGTRGWADSLESLTVLRRAAIRKNFRPLGFPTITFPSEGAKDAKEVALLAAHHVAKYAGFIVLDDFDPATIYALLTLRQNIYTDPQKPIQVSPGLYPISEPTPESPLLVTTNFSLTYFSVAGEVEGSGLPAWLLITDSEGMSVLTAWAAGKFDAEGIAKAVSKMGVTDKIAHRKIVIPGFVASISGELEDELPGWEVMVGPRESIGIPSYLKQWVTASQAT